MSRVSLGMIVKDETESLERCLVSVAPFVDEIVVGWNGTNLETKQILDKYKATVFTFEWKDDFAYARNLVYQHIKTELALWLDADDQLIGGENLRKHLSNFNDPRVGAVWLFYNYSQDQYGNCNSALWRERILRHKWFRWVGGIHEENIKKSDCIQLKVGEDQMYVLHHTTQERINDSAKRNLRISEALYKREHESNTVDAVNVWHYARSLDAMGFHEQSIPVFEEFIDITETDEHRFQAYIHLAEVFRKFRRVDRAINYDLNAMQIRPLWPDSYFGMAANMFLRDDWNTVLHWTQIGLSLKHPGENYPLAYDPLKVKVKPLEPLCFAFVQLGKFPEALTVCKKALEFVPNHPFFKSFNESLPKLIEQKRIESHCLELYDYLSRDGESAKLEPLSKAIPDIAKDHPVFVRLQNKFRNNGDGSNRIVIYCGFAYELWDPNSAKTGIGGSEEAVIYLSTYLAKLGWQVDVYNHCLDPGIYEGVHWRGIWEYDENVPAAVFIAWRDPQDVFRSPKDAYTVLWLHDRQKTEYYNQQIIDRIDKIFVLSNYHRFDLPEVSDDKFFITRNGIIPQQFQEKMPRNPLRCVYASSPDRGLDRVISLWPQIIKEIPEAELHIYYGFTKTYDELHRNNKVMLDFKAQIMNSIEREPSIHYHGRIGHAELAREFLQSGLWLYPTSFTEISCITAMKSQAAGMIPVTVNLAALHETVQYGYKYSFRADDARTQKAWTLRVINLLKDPAQQEKLRPAMMKWAQSYFDWKQVATEWSDLFKKELQCKKILNVS